jgi:shikimate kinase
MDPALATIVVALITTVGGLIGVAIKEFRSMKKTNSDDHGKVMARLEKVQDSVDHVAERLDDHIDWHLTKK